MLDHVLEAEPGHYQVAGYAPSIIIDGMDSKTGDAFVRVSDPAATSEARLSSGRVVVRVEGAGGIGREGQQAVAETLAQKLKENGLRVSFEPGIDSRGEDVIIRSATTQLVGQIVTTPSAPTFWREARLESTSTDVDLAHAANWLHNTVQQKAVVIPPAQRSATVLMIDARHASVIAHSTVVDQYATDHGDPAITFGFASVWIIGPTVRQTARLGSGFP